MASKLMSKCREFAKVVNLLQRSTPVSSHKCVVDLFSSSSKTCRRAAIMGLSHESSRNFLQNQHHHRFTCSAARLYCTSSVVCWNCHAELSRTATASRDLDHRVAAIFCPACNLIQPLEEHLNHFQIMGLEENFDLDVPDLTRRFRNLQRLLHPDKFSKASETEQSYSALHSSSVNRAYRVLLKPLSRGLYLLELNGFSIEEGESNIDPAFLMEVMELNEELADTSDLDTVRKIAEDNAVQLNALLDKLKDAFNKADFPTAREILMRLKYYANIDDKAKEKLGTN